MKKLSKKQKLIGFIAILIMAVVLATVITTNIVNNRTVVNVNYSTTSDNANSNLVANYIKKGITIGGITGTLESLNTFDATATPEDIIWGKTGYVKGEKITGTKIVTVAHAREAQKAFDANTILIDDYGNKVKVPAGFKIAEDSATAVTEGVVIEDVSAEGATEYTKGSQFVWVPVGDVIKDNDGNITTITLGRYTFNESGIKNLVQSAENGIDISGSTAIYGEGYNCQEAASSTLGNKTAKNLDEFQKTTLSSGGYYIGRYEAGDAYAKDNARTGTDLVSDPNNPLTCKNDVFPYSYVNQIDASNLCQNMYKSSKFESDLINSYAWDTAIVFIQEFSGDTNYSMQYGENTTKTVQKCGTSVLSIISNEDKVQDERCNIYDMAGNTFEWTTETDYVSGYPCTYRGGNNLSGYYSYTSYRYPYTTSGSYFDYSFRPILYL